MKKIFSLLVIVFVPLCFVYFSNTYLKLFSVYLGPGTGDPAARNCTANGDFSNIIPICKFFYGENLGKTGYYKINYLTHERVYYFRPWKGGEFPFQTYKMQSHFLPSSVTVNNFKVLDEDSASVENNYYYMGELTNLRYDKNFSKMEKVGYIKNFEGIYFRLEKLEDSNSSEYRFIPAELPLFLTGNGAEFLATNNKIFFGERTVVVTGEDNPVIDAKTFKFVGQSEDYDLYFEDVKNQYVLRHDGISGSSGDFYIEMLPN